MIEAGGPRPPPITADMIPQSTEMKTLSVLLRIEKLMERLVANTETFEGRKAEVPKVSQTKGKQR